MKKTNTIDMINGPILPKVLVFAVPLIISSVLQLLFNAADIIVVGRYSGSHSLAAVGATSSLINLLINLFVGVSIGASVVIGRYVGARDYDAVQDALHTSIHFALYSGIFMIFLGFFAARPLLELTETPIEVIDLSVLYMRIYFVGMPGFMLYNFGAAILRSVGDTKRPLYFLSVAGFVNVILNLIFVIKFKMGVAGVALATCSSQYVSAALIFWSLMHSEDFLRLHIKKIKMHKDILKEMLRVGLPAGFQGIIFNISNVLIQSSVNSFGSLVMAGNTAAANIEGFVYVSMNAVYQTALSFTSQNMGAKRYDRINKILLVCLGTVTVIGLVLGVGAYLAGDVLLSIYNSDPKVIEYGMNRLALVCAPYFLCGLMDVMVGSIRGMGYSIMPMIVSLTGACLFRIAWIFTVFKAYHTTFMLYISYPISWFLTFSLHVICYIVVSRKLLNKA